MNIALWIVAGVLAAVFLFAGLTKTFTSIDRLAEKMPWVSRYKPATVRFIGITEALGALGLILPGATGIAPVLVPWAATGLAVTMVLAIVHHARNSENQAIIANLVLLAAAVFVAWGRFGPYAF